MKKKLYLMRHGETLFNQLGKIQGACDSPLTLKGRQQAQLAANYFDEHKITFDHSYSSTQERAADTLEIILNVESYYRLKGLKEMNFGTYEGEPAFLQPKGAHSFEHYYEQFGGESAQQVQDRMVTTLIEVMNRPQHEQVLAVSHNGACFYFLKKFWEQSVDSIPTHFPNCSIFHFEFSDERFTLIDIIDPSTQKSIL